MASPYDTTVALDWLESDKAFGTIWSLNVVAHHFLPSYG
jgi:hypothetical protein